MIPFDMKKNYTKTEDGTYTLYSKEYNQNYHSTDDGALSETLYKHIVPMFEVFKTKKELHILDICFGLGFNTLSTIYFAKLNNFDMKLHFYSPELDNVLIEGLEEFLYPKELEPLKYIINALVKEKYYKDENIEVQLYIGDARQYIKKLDAKIDVVYQDAFSSDVNKELWTKEYFADIVKLLSEEALLTTYSIATPVRLSMSENNLKIYEYKTKIKRKSTIASTSDISEIIDVRYIDMEKKKINNPEAKPLIDNF